MDFERLAIHLHATYINNLYRRLFKIQSPYILQFEVENCDCKCPCQLHQSKYCCSFSVFVNIAVKYFTRSERMTQL